MKVHYWICLITLNFNVSFGCLFFEIEPLIVLNIQAKITKNYSQLEKDK